MRAAVELMERGFLPDVAVRYGIRRLCRRRLREEADGDVDAAVRRFVEHMESSPVALHTDAANEQHYEVPAAFFERCLGRRLKYSSAYWPPGIDTLDDAEEAMLGLTCARALLRDGQDVLELGCGWGSLTLWMAERYPRSRITALSNSASQREFILARAAERGLDNVTVVTANVADFAPDGRFDRVVSVEMFEHVRNWRTLLSRVAAWLRADGRFFAHVFCHRSTAYPFGTARDDDWMGRHFFTGGMMPSADLFERFDDVLEHERRWDLNGSHYARTAEAWLQNLDRRRDDLLDVFREVYGATDAERWIERWRVFFMACAELFGFEGGDEWFVVHHRMRPHTRTGR